MTTRPKAPAKSPGGLAVRLANGARVVLRPIRADDKGRLRDGMAALSPQARRQRFFSSKAELDTLALAYLTEVDHRGHAAWVAEDVGRPGQPIVAVGRYVRHNAPPGGIPDAGTAEVAFVVGDEYQRQGLATMLLELLSVTARANGVGWFSAQVQDDNQAMRSLLSNRGAHFHHDEPGVVVTTFAVPEPSDRFPARHVHALLRAAARDHRRRLRRDGRLPAVRRADRLQVAVVQEPHDRER